MLFFRRGCKSFEVVVMEKSSATKVDGDNVNSR